MNLSLFNPPNKRLFISLYLMVLVVFSFSYWQFLNFVEVFITTAGNQLTAIIYNQPLDTYQVHDSSSIIISSDINLNLMLTFPDGSRAGDDLFDLRYPHQQVSYTSTKYLTESSLDKPRKITQLQDTTISTPPIGKYTLTASSRQGGTFPVTAIFTDRQGIYSKFVKLTLHLAPNTKTKYRLYFHKDLVHRAKITPISPQNFISSLTTQLKNQFQSISFQ